MIMFLREIRRNRKAFIIWAFCLIISNLGMMAFFPYMDDKMGAMADMLKQLPKGLSAGLGIDGLVYTDMMSYFAYILQYILLFSGIYAIQLGASILSKEESERTAEFLLSKPVTRSAVIASKAVCILVFIVIYNLLFTVADYFTFPGLTTEAYDMKTFLLMHLAQPLMQVTLAALGLLVSVFVVKTKTVLPLSLGIVLGFYALNIISALSDRAAFLKYLTPFKYLNPSDIVKNVNIEPLYLAIMAAAIVVSTVGAFIFYNKKDIAV